MVYRFLLLSDEIDNFKREITIDSDASFLDLNNAILDSVKYTKDQMTSFFLCEDDWSKTTEITLMEMDTSSDVDSYVMENTSLSSLIEDEKQKILFVFDYFTERVFFMELSEIIVGKNQKTPICSLSIGAAPEQNMSFDDNDLLNSSVSGLDENFFGDEEFDMDELDRDGFDGLDALEDMGSNPYDDQ